MSESKTIDEKHVAMWTAINDTTGMVVRLTQRVEALEAQLSGLRGKTADTDVPVVAEGGPFRCRVCGSPLSVPGACDGCCVPVTTGV